MSMNSIAPFARGRRGRRGRVDAYSIIGFKPELVAAFAGASEYYRAKRLETTFDGLLAYTGEGGTMTDSDGLLKHSARNESVYSEDFTQRTNSGVTPTANYALAPNGEMTASRIVCVGDWTIYPTAINVRIGDVRTIKCWVKSNTGASQDFILFGNDTIASSTLTATTAWQLFEFEYTVTVAGAVLCGLANVALAAADLLVWGQHDFPSDLGGMVSNPDADDRLLAYPGYETYVPTAAAAVYKARRRAYRRTVSSWVLGGIRAEGAATTNLIVRSIPGTSGAWTSSTAGLTQTLNAPGVTSPDGNENFTLYLETATTAQHYVATPAWSAAGGTRYVFSGYLKAAGTDTIWQMIFSNASHGSTYYANFDLAADGTGSVLTVVGGRAYVEHVGGGVYRVSSPLWPQAPLQAVRALSWARATQMALAAHQRTWAT